MSKSRRPITDQRLLHATGAQVSAKQSPHGIVWALATIGAGALVIGGSRVLINFFGPQPRFAMSEDLNVPLDSEEFIQFLSIVTDGTRRCSNCAA